MRLYACVLFVITISQTNHIGDFVFVVTDALVYKCVCVCVCVCVCACVHFVLISREIVLVVMTARQDHIWISRSCFWSWTCLTFWLVTDYCSAFCLVAPCVGFTEHYLLASRYLLHLSCGSVRGLHEALPVTCWLHDTFFTCRVAACVAFTKRYLLPVGFTIPSSPVVWLRAWPSRSVTCYLLASRYLLHLSCGCVRGLHGALPVTCWLHDTFFTCEY